MELGQLSEYFGAMVAGVPLVLVVIGLVEWFKRIGLEGRELLYVSMAVGFILGFAYMLAETRPPSGDWWVLYVYIFTCAVYALGLGVVASGLYDAVKAILKPKAE
jgi:Ca2+/Na+ antiporter